MRIPPSITFHAKRVLVIRVFNRRQCKISVFIICKASHIILATFGFPLSCCATICVFYQTNGTTTSLNTSLKKSCAMMAWPHCDQDPRKRDQLMPPKPFWSIPPSAKFPYTTVTLPLEAMQ